MEALTPEEDRRQPGSISQRKASPFVEKISAWLVIIAAFGGFIVLLDPSIQGKVLGFDWKIGVGEFSPELKGAVVNTMLLGGFSGVIAFWLGATKSQERTTDSLSRIAEATPAVVSKVADKVPDAPRPDQPTNGKDAL